MSMANLPRADEPNKKTIIRLLRAHEANVDALNRYQRDDLIQEWQEEYQCYLTKGDPTALLGPREDPAFLRLQENLLQEKKDILARMQELQMQVHLVRILLIHLDEGDIELIRLRYFDNFSVGRVCEELYISRSTFYRRNDEILGSLSEHYKKIFLS